MSANGDLPVVLVPALLCDHRLYTDVSLAVSDLASVDSSVVALPTLADAAAHVLANGPPRFLIGGTSFGGHVALEVALAAPDRVAGLLLMGVNPGPHGSPQAGEGMADRIRDGDFDAVIDELAAACIYELGDPTGHKRDLFREMAQIVGPQRAINQINALVTRADRRDDLAQLTMPVFLIWGEQDQVSPPAHAQLIAAQAASSRTVLIPDCGHFPALEMPDAVTEPVREWITRSTGAGY